MALKRITKGNLWGFIQSRPYCSVSDIRRLFTMDVEGAAPIRTSEGTAYVGLSQDAAELIRQLCHEGRVALDLNPNVKARVVQGVFPARLPAPRSGQPVHEGTAAGDGRKRRRKRRRPGAAGDSAPVLAPTNGAEAP